MEGMSRQKMHFTELPVIIQIMASSLEKQSLKLRGCVVSPGQDIFKAEVCSLEKQGSKSKKISIKIVQIQYIISVVIVETANEDSMVVDTFWFDYRNYLTKNLQTYYLLSELKQDSLEAVSEMFRKRIAKAVGSKDERPLILAAAYQNLILLNRFLSARDFRNLQISSVGLYKMIHRQEQYKMLFEARWGCTGFELQERNWIKTYQSKMGKRK